MRCRVSDYLFLYSFHLSLFVRSRVINKIEAGIRARAPDIRKYLLALDLANALQ